MDTIVDFGNLLLLASLSSIVSTAVDGISITGKVADSPMVREETIEIGEIGDVIDPFLEPSMAVDVSAAGGKADVPPLVLEEVAGGGAAGGDVADPLLPPEGATYVVAAGEGIGNEPNIPSFNLDPPKSKETLCTVFVAHIPIIYKDLP